MYSSRHSQASLALTASVLLAGCLAGAGCRMEKAPSRIQSAEQRQQKLADTPLPVLQQPETDDAATVVAACGQPNSDTVLPIYSKFYNGPVRRLEYVGKREVKLDFIPSRPKAELAYTEAPLPHASAESLPPNSTWRFEAGFMEQEQMITSRRLALYLPCAGQALSREF